MLVHEIYSMSHKLLKCLPCNEISSSQINNNWRSNKNIYFSQIFCSNNKNKIQLYVLKSTTCITIYNKLYYFLVTSHLSTNMLFSTLLYLIIFILVTIIFGMFFSRVIILIINRIWEHTELKFYI